MVVGRDDFQRVPANPECTPVKIVVVSFVMDFAQAGNQGLKGPFLANFDRDDHSGVIFGRAQAINAGNTGHNDDVPAREKRMGGRMAQFVDIVVDRGIFFYVGVGSRHVCFRLIIVIITYKIFHGISGKKLAELVIELGRKSLVGRENKRGPVAFGNYICHTECFAGTGYAKKHLAWHSGPDILADCVNGLGLVAGWRVICPESERNGWRIDIQNFRFVFSII